MSMHYATEAAERDPHTLPNILVWQFTAHEIAETMEEEIWDYSRKPQFKTCHMNGQVRERMLDTMVKELGIEGGFMWAVCFPGCMPDSEWSGPFPTHAEALQNARDILGDAD